MLVRGRLAGCPLRRPSRLPVRRPSSARNGNGARRQAGVASAPVRTAAPRGIGDGPMARCPPRRRRPRAWWHRHRRGGEESGKVPPSGRHGGRLDSLRRHLPRRRRRRIGRRARVRGHGRKRKPTLDRCQPSHRGRGPARGVGSTGGAANRQASRQASGRRGRGLPRASAALLRRETRCYPAFVASMHAALLSPSSAARRPRHSEVKPGRAVCSEEAAAR
jgi:hypothetical protein